ncbi:hypothetical protein GCM10010095_83190 [Streptomyces anthocyanicus]|nr:hypothetical protein GCM10010095_83190 [Streptomyces anthocyanicus]
MSGTLALGPSECPRRHIDVHKFRSLQEDDMPKRESVDFTSLADQAQQMQDRLSEVQADMAALEERGARWRRPGDRHGLG